MIAQQPIGSPILHHEAAVEGGHQVAARVELGHRQQPAGIEPPSLHHTVDPLRGPLVARVEVVADDLAAGLGHAQELPARIVIEDARACRGHTGEEIAVIVVGPALGPTQPRG